MGGVLAKGWLDRDEVVQQVDLFAYGAAHCASATSKEVDDSVSQL